MTRRAGHDRGCGAGRRGFSSLEAVAALTILLGIVGSTMPLLVRHLRLLADSRHERIATQELANLAERLASLPAADVEAFLSRPPLSDLARRRLPEAVLTARRGQADAVVLALSWDSPGRAQQPLQLAVWLPAAAGEPRPEATR